MTYADALPVDQASSIKVQLYDHGIYQDRSDWRCHVSPHGKVIHVFRTPVMRDWVRAMADRGLLVEKTVTVDGGERARGYVVPVEDVQEMVKSIPYPSYAWEKFPLEATHGTLEKAYAAEECVIAALWDGLVHFPSTRILAIHREREKSRQIAGHDLIVITESRVQVKADYRACPYSVHYRGTGNLFIQTAEVNPDKLF